jgi:plastocyanin
MMRLSRLRVGLGGIGASVLLAASVGSAVRAQTTVEVPIQAFVYQPAVLSVPVGTTVVWTNLDPVPHTVTDYDGAYDSGDFAERETFSMTFNTPGVYEYYCVPHPIMIGRVEVTN